MSKIKYLDVFEIRAFFDAIRKMGSVRDWLIFRFLYCYGLRVSELVRIQLSDIKPDLNHPVEIEIHRSKQGIDRHYPITIGDLVALKKWLTKRSKINKANAFLFITDHSGDGPMSMINCQKLHLKYATAADISPDKRNNVHCWRHSTAISLLNAGYDVFYIKSWLGHKSIQSSMIYLEVSPPQWKNMSKHAINTFEV